MKRLIELGKSEGKALLHQSLRHKALAIQHHARHFPQRDAQCDGWQGKQGELAEDALRCVDELPICHGMRGAEIEWAIQRRALYEESDHAGNILFMRPGEPLPSIAEATPQQLREAQERRQRAHMGVEYKTCPYDAPPGVGLSGSGFPLLADQGAESLSWTARFGKQFLPAITVVSRGRRLHQHCWRPIALDRPHHCLTSAETTLEDARSI
jgi:hypothetical protein